MSKALRLVSVINKFIVEKWTDVRNGAVVKVERVGLEGVGEELGSVLVYFTGTAVFDEFYSVAASASIDIPSNSKILVTEWSLTYERSFHIEILGAELVELVKLSLEVLTPIERNPLICKSLRKMKHWSLRSEYFGNVKEEGVGENLKLEGSLRVKEESEDDCFDMIELNPEVEMPKSTALASLKPLPLKYEDIGLSTFPPYALEYLKHKYNLI